MGREEGWVLVVGCLVGGVYRFEVVGLVLGLYELTVAEVSMNILEYNR